MLSRWMSKALPIGAIIGASSMAIPPAIAQSDSLQAAIGQWFAAISESPASTQRLYLQGTQVVLRLFVVCWGYSESADYSRLDFGKAMKEPAGSDWWHIAVPCKNNINCVTLIEGAFAVPEANCKEPYKAPSTTLQDKFGSPAIYSAAAADRIVAKLRSVKP